MDAQKIKAYRRDTGLTQAQFGAMLGVSSCTVSNWEAGRYEPNRAVRLKLAVLMGEHSREVQRKRLDAIRAAQRSLDHTRGKMLRMLRMQHGFTVGEFSGMIGTTPAIVIKWENGEYTMPGATIKWIEQFFRDSLAFPKIQKSARAYRALA